MCPGCSNFYPKREVVHRDNMMQKKGVVMIGMGRRVYKEFPFCWGTRTARPATTKYIQGKETKLKLKSAQGGLHSEKV